MDKTTGLLVVVFLLSIVVCLYGILTIHHTPKHVNDSPVDVRTGTSVDSNYLGDAYVVTLAGNPNKSFKYSLNENYRKSQYEMEIYYTNNTGLHTDIDTFGGGGFLQ